MTWLQRYKLRNFVQSSLWLPSILAALLAVISHRLVWKFNLMVHWELLGYSLESARAIVSAISSAMLTFTVFLMSMIFLAIQLAVGQLTPRIVAFAFRDRVIKLSLSVFTFTYVFSISALGRLERPVPELVVLLTILLSIISIGTFLFFVDYMGKALRPISICARLANAGVAIIEFIYPRLPGQNPGEQQAAKQQKIEGVCLTIFHEGRSGIIMAFDAPGLLNLAVLHNCVIRLVPQVGDFVPTGDALFSIYQGGKTLDSRQLGQSLVFGVERTTEQDPEFVFRIIVDVAIKALSPTINDPTTAIACIDQLHRLLRRVGERDLGDGCLRDREGTVRLTFPTPEWEDFVQLAVTEILQYGADSIQVIRRLRAMLADLLAQLPEKRHPAVRAQLDLLGRIIEQNFTDPLVREFAMSGDYMGVGGARR